MSKLEYEKRDRIARLTINRPDARNAIDPETHDLLCEAWADFRDDDDVDVAILTGAGDDAFCAGADLKTYIPPKIAGATPGDIRKVVELGFGGLTRGLHRIPKPTIAAVNGWALAGGLELSLACDIRIASDRARFGLPETGLGVLPGAGGTQRLARLVGKGRAVELILTGRTLDAEEALRIGLVTSVVPPEELLGAARATAAQILAKGPLAVRLGKLVIKNGFETDQRTGLLLERLAQSLLYASPEKAEGTGAFLDKRPADFGAVAE